MNLTQTAHLFQIQSVNTFTEVLYKSKVLVLESFLFMAPHIYTFQREIKYFLCLPLSDSIVVPLDKLSSSSYKYSWNKQSIARKLISNYADNRWNHCSCNNSSWFQLNHFNCWLDETNIVKTFLWVLGICDDISRYFLNFYIPINYLMEKIIILLLLIL